MKKMKVAVIGCGTIGNVHADAYAACPQAEIAWAVDLISEKATAIANQFGAAKTTADYKEALADPEVEAVSVCLPNDLHCPVTVDALNAGKHVLCEKPIALSVAQALEMQSAAQKNKKLLAIGVVNRFNDGVRHLRDVIQSGQLGRVYHVSVMFKAYRSIPGLGGWFTTKARSGGGVMIDWGVHYFDLAMFCLGFPKPLTVSGVAHSELAKDPKKYAFVSMWAGPPDYKGVYDVEEYAAGLVRTDGPMISFEGAWAQNVEEGAGQIDFLGDKGGVHLKYGGAFTVYTNKNGVLYKTHPSYQTGNMFHTEIASFVECAMKGKESPAVINTVIPTQRILDGFYKSAETGKEVSV